MPVTMTLRPDGSASPPDTLPADFFDKKGSAAPDTLPADFFDKKAKAKASPTPISAPRGGNIFSRIADNYNKTEGKSYSQMNDDWAKAGKPINDLDGATWGNTALALSAPGESALGEGVQFARRFGKNLFDRSPAGKAVNKVGDKAGEVWSAIKDSWQAAGKDVKPPTKAPTPKAGGDVAKPDDSFYKVHAQVKKAMTSASSLYKQGIKAKDLEGLSAAERTKALGSGKHSEETFKRILFELRGLETGKVKPPI